MKYWKQLFVIIVTFAIFFVAMTAITDIICRANGYYTNPENISEYQ